MEIIHPLNQFHHDHRLVCVGVSSCCWRSIPTVLAVLTSSSNIPLKAPGTLLRFRSFSPGGFGFESVNHPSSRHKINLSLYGFAGFFLVWTSPIPCIAAVFLDFMYGFCFKLPAVILPSRTRYHQPSGPRLLGPFLGAFLFCLLFAFESS